MKKLLFAAVVLCGLFVAKPVQAQPPPPVEGCQWACAIYCIPWTSICWEIEECIDVN